MPGAVSDTGSRLFVRCRFVREELERVVERGAEDAVAVASAAGGAGKVHDGGRTDRAGDAAGELRVGGVMERVRAQRLRDPGRLPVENVLRRFRGDVARGETRAARRQDEPRLRGELANRVSDERTLVRHHAADDLVAVPAEHLREKVSASVF